MNMTMKNKIFGSLCLAVMLFLTSGCEEYSYDAGKTAYNQRDFVKAKEIWKEVAEKQQDNNAMFSLYNLHKTAPHIVSYEESLGWLIQAAEAGRQDAQYEYGVFLIDQGKYEKGYYYIEQSAMWKDEQAKAYLEKYGPIKDVRLKVEKGDLYAMYQYADWLLKQINENLSENEINEINKEARSWVLKSARGGCHDGEALFGKMLYNQQDFANALTWIQKAANANNPIGIYYLGLMYMDGNGVIRNTSKGAELLIQASELKEPNAQLKLAMMYFAEKLPTTITLEPEKAISWVSASADNGVVEAQYILGKLYEDAFGVTRDTAKAIHYYKLAADQNHLKSKLKFAQLSLMHGSTEQQHQALNILNTLITDKNSSEASLILGDLYLTGQGVPKDEQKGIDLLKKAAETGNREAQYKLGVLMFKGEIIEKNIQRAVYWISISATQEYPKAMLALCELYARGLGVKKNTQKSNMWCEKAQEVGATDRKLIVKELGLK